MSLGSSSSNLQKVENILGKPVLTFIIGAGSVKVFNLYSK